MFGHRGIWLVGLVFLCGCKAVYLDSPLGDPISAEDAFRFVGEWERQIGKDESKDTTSPRWQIRLQKDGRLQLAELKWSQEDQQFLASTHQAVVTKVGKLRFLNFIQHGVQDGPSPSYTLTGYEWLGNASVKLFPANFDEFRKLIEADELPGEIVKDGQNRSLSVAAEDVAQWLVSHPQAADKLFSVPDADRLIVVRVRKADDRQQRFSRDLIDVK